MYFESRASAGEKLARLIAQKYNGDDCAVVALSDGGVIVGAQIAMKLHAPLMLLLAERITLPREHTALAGISQDGSFSYNKQLSQGEIDGFVSEYHHYIEAEKMAKLRKLHRATHTGDLIRKDLLRQRHVILVSDGLEDGFALDVAMQFLKPVNTKQIVVATPFASIAAVDRMHIMADEIFCLNVLEHYRSTDHYYDTQDVPEHGRIVATVEKIVAHWR